MITRSSPLICRKGATDEWNTPIHAVLPILEYVPKGAIVWCPFDTQQSNFVRCISQRNKVVYSHICYGQDFFDYEPSEWDVMVSNPPFSLKHEVFKRALSFGKPFALLMNLQWLHDRAPHKIWGKKEWELLIPDRRIHFVDTNGRVHKKTIFKSGYFCHRFLPKQFVPKTVPDVRYVRMLLGQRNYPACVSLDDDQYPALCFAE